MSCSQALFCGCQLAEQLLHGPLVCSSFLRNLRVLAWQNCDLLHMPHCQTAQNPLEDEAERITIGTTPAKEHRARHRRQRCGQAAKQSAKASNSKRSSTKAASPGIDDEFL